jgi:hypothetical protein
MPYQSPDVSGMGKVSGMTPLYQGIQTDRNAPDILDALKTNPYTLSVVNGL